MLLFSYYVVVALLFNITIVMSTYQYYYRNFLTFFLLSSFCYQNSFLIPQLAGIKLFLSCYNIKRLRASVELNYLSFLIFLGLQPKNIKCQTQINNKNLRYFFTLTFRAQQTFIIFERLIFFLYASFHVNPIVTSHFSNNVII